METWAISSAVINFITNELRGIVDNVSEHRVTKKDRFPHGESYNWVTPPSPPPQKGVG